MRLVGCPWSQPEFWSRIEDEVKWMLLPGLWPRCRKEEVRFRFMVGKEIPSCQMTFWYLGKFPVSSLNI